LITRRKSGRFPADIESNGREHLEGRHVKREYRHDEWEVDVMISSSQKGLMLPPGLAFNAISEKALAANKTAKMPRSTGIGERFWN